MIHLVYQTEQIRQLEKLAEDNFGISPDVLMQRAGQAACEYLLRHWSLAKHIAVFCGPGNNGGDGYVVALCALKRGLKVQIYQIGDFQNLKGAALNAYQACENAGALIKSFTQEDDLTNYDVIVDAIFGIGIHGDLRDNVKQAIKSINSANVPVFSIDIPTGVNPDTGFVEHAVNATSTITFLGLKLGLLTGDGPGFVGKLIFDDLQLPTELYATVKSVAEVIRTQPLAKRYLAKRKKHLNKGHCGHVLVIGGDFGYSGAAKMAAEAALRVGAGLVSVATRLENSIVMNINRPEIMCHAVEDEMALVPLYEKANVILIGPGLGKSGWGKMLLQKLLLLEKDNISGLKKSIIVDADGLNLIANEFKNEQLKMSNWIITPHPGEAARLLQMDVQTVQRNRLDAVSQLQKKYSGIAILKGAGTLVQSDEHTPAICIGGNPGMATAGMGDILSGVLAGFLAQGIPLFAAALLGVGIHAAAGDQAAKIGGERGMIATDLLLFLRQNVNIESEVYA